MTTNFHTAKKGDRVWSASMGWGTIDSVCNNRLHPICVEFDAGRFNTYTLDGKITKACDRDLFWGEVGLKLPPKLLERCKVSKPTHTINGVEIPDLRVSPEYGEYYYLADPTVLELSTLYRFTGTTIDRIWVERGLTYQSTEEGKQAAILHVKAVLGSFEETEECMEISMSKTTNAHNYNINIRFGEFEGEYCFEAKVKEFPNIAEYADTYEEAYLLAIDTIETLAEIYAEQRTKRKTEKIIEELNRD